MNAKATFAVESWDEQPIFEKNGAAKATRAVVSRSFEGDVAGEGTVEWLMGYREDGTATFVGLERVVGRLGERAGSFLLQHAGSFDGKSASGTVTVVPGSGTEDLRELEGEGSFEAGMGEDGERSFTLEYEV